MRAGAESVGEGEVGLAGEGLGQGGAGEGIVGAPLAVPDGGNGEEESVRALAGSIVVGVG